MKLLTGETKEVQIELTPDEPLRAKKRRPDVRSSGRRTSYTGSSSQQRRYDRAGGDSRSRGGRDYRDRRDYSRDGGGNRDRRDRDYDGGGSRPRSSNYVNK
jgi:ATP-dependent RNA helicase DeaD